ncbi:hypothetical protein B0H11DRAFT_1905971 [Mycena galericulata]|nr:hypothetical protein B0H11DRAFT_1905971 [Mycena galericulata]
MKYSPSTASRHEDGPGVGSGRSFPLSADVGSAEPKRPLSPRSPEEPCERISVRAVRRESGMAAGPRSAFLKLDSKHLTSYVRDLQVDLDFERQEIQAIAVTLLCLFSNVRRASLSVGHWLAESFPRTSRLAIIDFLSLHSLQSILFLGRANGSLPSSVLLHSLSFRTAVALQHILVHQDSHFMPSAHKLRPLHETGDRLAQSSRKSTGISAQINRESTQVLTCYQPQNEFERRSRVKKKRRERESKEIGTRLKLWYQQIYGGLLPSGEDSSGSLPRTLKNDYTPAARTIFDLELNLNPCAGELKKEKNSTEALDRALDPKYEVIEPQRQETYRERHRSRILRAHSEPYNRIPSLPN